MKDYCIMHKERHVATIRRDGSCTVYYPQFMPYNLYLETVNDPDTRFQNISNFYYWCASRILTLDRIYAKEILNTLGMKQAVTDKDRAEIALSYHCVCLTDVYWVREKNEPIRFANISLYTHSLSDAFVDVSLFGKQLTAQNAEMLNQKDTAGDVATSGMAPKAWIRRENRFWLLKDGGQKEVEAELLASKIAGCLQMDSVPYESLLFRGQKVSACSLITSEEYSIVSAEYVSVYAENHSTTLQNIVLSHDAYGFHMMNLFDYLVGNNDRHWGNWGFLVDNRTNRIGKLHPLMDFNRAFTAYDTLEGVRCLTIPGTISQLEAARKAVESIGLPMIKEVNGDWFQNPEQYQMFMRRLNLLRGNQ